MSAVKKAIQSAAMQKVRRIPSTPSPVLMNQFILLKDAAERYNELNPTATILKRFINDMNKGVKGKHPRLNEYAPFKNLSHCLVINSRSIEVGIEIKSTKNNVFKAIAAKNLAICKLQEIHSTLTAIHNFERLMIVDCIALKHQYIPRMQYQINNNSNNPTGFLTFEFNMKNGLTTASEADAIIDIFALAKEQLGYFF